MSHGAAGFAYALGALADASGDLRFVDEAYRWLAVERQHRRTESALHPQWCHGATGAGLAMLGLADQGFKDDALREDIAQATVTAEQAWPDRVDTLCCGTLGNIELLVAAGMRDIARQRLLSVISAKSSRGGYRWSGGSDRFNVGLFRGLAGVGYTCLRMIDDSLPNILVWA